MLDPNQPVPVYAGDDVTFNIEVFNQGSVDAYNIDVTDFIPAGFVLNDTDWSPGANNTALFMIVGPITPGNSTVVPITLTVTPSAAAGNLTNTAEISDFEDVNGDHPIDTDSTPDDDPTNDGPADDDTTDNSNGDEDDSDPATVPVAVFDLALTKALSPTQSTPVTIGDDVTYVIEVCNQGTVDALNVEVVDYLPTGMTLNDPAWSLGSLNQAYITLAGPITPATCQSVNVTVTIVSIPTSGTYENVAEISSAEDPAGNNPPDIDSTADDENGNDGPHDDGTTDGSNGDEDDADPAIISVIIPECNAFNDGPACFDGPVVLSESGGTAVSWAWTGPNGFTSTDQNPLINPAAAGIYTVTITDSNGLSSECETEVAVLPELTLDVLATDALCLGSADGAIDISVQGGTTPYAFAWDNGATTEDVTGLAAGTYAVTITDASGCMIAGTYTVAEPSELSCSTSGLQNLSCFEAADGELSSAGAGGTAPYEYSVDGGAWQPGGTFTGLTAGLHTVTVRDANGCISNCEGTLTEPALLSCTTAFTNETDCLVDDGTITATAAGGTAPYSYSLNGAAGQTTGAFTGLGAGSYVITITDGQGCETECEATLTTPEAPVCDITSSTDVTCNGGSNGELTATGTAGNAPLEYSIDGAAFQASGTFTGLTAGVYTVTVRNQGNTMCTSTCSVTITEPAAISCSLSATPVSCNGLADGTLEASAIGGSGDFEYSIDAATFQLSNNFTALVAGTYTVTVRDAQDINCTSTCVIEITEPVVLACSLAPTMVSCNGGTDGTITTTATGGTAPFTYSLNGSPYQPGNSFAGVAAGTHTVSTLDDNGCETSCTIVVTEPAVLACTASATDATDCFADDGTVTGLAVGGTTPYQYSLDGGTAQAAGTFADLGPGTYTVTITDALGCTTDCEATVIAPDVPMCEITTVTDASCNGASDGSLESVGSGGSGIFEYSIDGLAYQASGIFTGLPAGVYTITVRNTDSPSCTSTCSATIAEPEVLTCSVVATPESCYLTDGTVTSSSLGGTLPYEYSIDGTAYQSSNVFTGLVPGDYTIYTRDANGCEVNCSVEVVPDCFDMALTKALAPGQASPVAPGDLVTYDIEVCNQGTIDAFNIEVVDYTPAGMIMADPTWTVGSNSNEVFQTIGGPLAPAACQTLTITMQVDPAYAGGSLQNFAEISEADDDTDPNNGGGDDWDSSPDNDPDNDGNYVDGATDDTGGDEDDHDPAEVLVEFFDLALDKTVSASQVMPITPGDDITFDIEICNQGTIDGYNVVLSDTYPPFCTLSAADTNGWVDQADGTAELTYAGPVAVGACEVVSIVLTLDQAATPGDFSNVVEIDGAEDENGNPQDDIDSDGGNDDGDQSEDDEDNAPFTIEVFDLALLKVVSPNQPMPIQPGDDVTFVITVINQGTVDAYNTVITDYIPAGLTLNDNNWVPSVNNSATFVLAGPLTAGSSQDVSITVTVTPGFSGGATNVAEISDSEDADGNHPEDEDSTPDSDPNNDNEEDGVTDGTNGDEDDSDPASIVVDVFDLALTKSLAPTQVVPVTLGDDVTYDIEVCNQGTIDGYNVEVVDYLPAGLTLNDANWSLGAANQAYTTLAGPITPSTCQIVQITCTITAIPTDGGYQNFAEISSAEDENGIPQDDIDSTADDSNTNDGPYDDDTTDGSNGDEDDHDPAYIPVELFDLALDKSLSPSQVLPIRPGDDITFDIEICNQGTVDGYNVQLTDQYPASTTLSANDTNWTDNGTNATMTYAGPVMVGTCETVQIILTLDPAATPMDYTNTVEIDGAEDVNGNPQDDIDSDGGNDDGDQSEDDEDDAPFTVETFDLALEKTLDPNQQTPVFPGDDVVFFIEVINQGSMDAYNIVVTDYIPAGMTLNDAGWSIAPGGTATKTIPGPLAAGTSSFVSITLTVDPSITGSSATNTAEISDAQDEDGNHPEDEDSRADSDPNNDPEVDGVTDNENGDEDDSDPATVPLATFDLALTKVVAPTQALPVTLGDAVTYEITVENQGTVDAYNVEVVDYLPACMSLNDANWFLSNNGAAYTTIAGPIAAGTSTTVSIELTIDCAPPAGTFDNTAEIADAEDVNGNNPPDSDSSADDNPNNEGPVSDDVTDGSNGDEDDSDPASIPFQIFDLALNKELSANQVLPITPGDDITFDIEICNQGTIDGYNVGLVDHLPASTNLSVNDALWTQAGTDATYTYPGPLTVGECATVEIVLTLDADAAPGSFENVVEITGGEDENGTPQEDIDSDSGNDDGDQSEDDEDNAPFEIETFDLALTKILDPTQVTPVYPGDNVEYLIEVENQGTITAYNVDVIDYIPAGFVLNDPNWQSIGSNATYTVNGPLAPGTSEVISITLTVDNTATAGDATNYAEITDAEDANGNHPNDEDSTADSDDTNDGPSDDNSTDNSNGDEDDHDPAVVPVAIFDVALEKSLASGQDAVVTVGDDVTYQIEVFNQGSVDAYQVDVVDYIPTGMSLNDATWTAGTSNQAYATIAGPIAAGSSAVLTIVVHIDSLPASGLFQNFAEISDAEDANGNHPEDADSTPDDNPDNDGPVTDGDIDGAGSDNGEDEDDHDPAVVGVQVFDLALLKELDPAQQLPIYPGDDVNFIITLLNQGTVDGYNVGLVDYIPAGMVLSANDANGWTAGAPGTAVMTYAGPLAAGNSTTVEILLTLDPTAGAGDYNNVAEITGAENADGDAQTDIDSTPDDTPGNDSEVDGVSDGTNGDEDDSDPAPFSVEVFDLALTKVLSPNTVVPVYAGDDVTFLIEVFNQGTIAAMNVEVTDFLPAGFTLNDINWSDLGGYATRNIAGPLSPGTSEVLSITMTFDGTTSGTAHNVAEISDAQDTEGNHPTDIDSTADNDPSNDGPMNDDSTDGSNGDEDDSDPASVLTGSFDLALVKTVSASTVMPLGIGSDVVYDIEVVNQGTVDAYNVEVVDYLPAGMSLNDSNWSASSNGSAYTTVAGPIAAGTSTTITITTTIDEYPSAGGFTNTAEISSAEDANGNQPEDVDSTADDNPGNEGPVSDDLTDGSGGDEDDSDPAFVSFEEPVFDLALVKTVSASTVTPVALGDNVTYDIEVINQGEGDAYNVEVVDYLPAGMSLNDANWSMGGGAAYTTIAGPIAAGTSTVVTITLTIDAYPANGTYDNTAEISDFEDEYGNHPEDVDSTPDDTNGNDGPVTDGATDGTNGDEDDSDPASLPITEPVYDLALLKTLSASNTYPVSLGDDVSYDIEVFNQGTGDAYNVEVVDYLPFGMVLNDANWAATSGGATTTVAGPIAAGSSTVVTITLTITDYPADGTYVNTAEISAFEDEFGDEQYDIDSTPDGIEGNDGQVTDGVTDGSNGDEDDSDPAMLSIEEPIYDLALLKTLSASNTYPVSIGDDVSYDIEVFNQGTGDAYNVEVVDYLPVGMVLNDANWLMASGAAVTSIAGPLSPGTSTVVTITLTITDYPTSGSFDNTAEISDFENEFGDHPEDVDSNPDNTEGNDGLVTDGVTDGSNGDEDDSDPASLPFTEPVFDLALVKTVSSLTVTPVALGDNVTYDIEVINQGEGDAYNVNVVDYLPAGMSLNDANWSMGGSAAYTTIAGPIVAGTSTVITITLTIDAYPANGTYDNTAEISDFEDEYGNHPEDVDSTPDDTNGNDGPVTDGATDGTNGDEDDSDPASLPISEPVFDLALEKTVSASTVTPVAIGDDVTYDIEVINQGQADAYNVEVVDYLPAGMSLNDANWSMGSAGAYTTIAGPIAAGTSTVVTITLTIDAYPTNGGFTNTAEISEAEDQYGNNPVDVDSTADDNDGNEGPVSDGVTDGSNGDEDDSDPAFLPMGEPVFDLALMKTLSPGQASTVAIGDDVDYTITVYNQGSDPVYNVQVVDTPPAGFVLNDAAWSLGLDGKAYQYYPGPLAPGNSVDLTITLTVTPDAAGGDMTNVAEISSAEDAQGNEIDDVDSTMDSDVGNDGPFTDNVVDGENGDEDDSDPAVVNVGVFDLALMKTLSSGQAPEVHLGDVATFTITVINQGNVDAHNIVIADYYPAGLTPVDPDWNDNGTYAGYFYAGPLAPGQSVQVDIDLEVTSDAVGPVVNTAEIASAMDANGNFQEDIDSFADNQYGNDGTTTDNELFGANGDEDDEDIAGIYLAAPDDHDGCNCGIECEINILDYTVSDCDPNGTGNAEFYVDFGCQWSNASDDFLVSDNYGNIYGPYPYGNQFQLGPIGHEGDSYVFTIYDSEYSGCTAVTPVIDAPDCNLPCSLSFSAYSVSECDDNGEFVVNFGYDWQNGGTSFQVFDNVGNSYQFNYGDPVSVGPYAGDGTSEYIFTIQDNVNTACTDVSAIITAPLCEDEIGELDGCELFQASAIVDCESNGDYYIVFTLFGAPETTNGYTISSTHANGFNGLASESFIDGPFAAGTGIDYTVALTSLPECTIAIDQPMIECTTTDIELLMFAGEVLENGNLLKWSTASEVDNDYFILSRSLDGVTGWNELAEVQGAGNSSTTKHYNDMDEKAPSGTSYYRLETVEFDGTRKVASQVISLERERNEFEFIEVYPVPTTSIVNAEFNSVADQGSFTYRVFDTQGKVIFSKQQDVVGGTNLIQVDMTYFSAGAYFLSIANGDQIINTQIIKR